VAPCFDDDVFYLFFLSFGNRTQNSRVAGATQPPALQSETTLSSPQLHLGKKKFDEAVLKEQGWVQ
jgi:hypothetical protein